MSLLLTPRPSSWVGMEGGGCGRGGVKVLGTPLGACKTVGMATEYASVVASCAITSTCRAASTWVCWASQESDDDRKWTLVCTVPRFSQLLYRYKPKSISDSLCVCVYCCSTYDKAVRVGGGVCVCVSCNYLALVLSLCCSTGVAARQVFVADHSGVSLLCKRSILEPLI